jgi:alpha-ketoglutarate-dependent taurine dioxygenase
MKKLPTIKRQVVSLSEEELVKTEWLQPGKSLPLVVQPAIDGVNLINWVKLNQSWLESQLRQYGGILFRNFEPKGVAEFEEFIQVVSGELLEYRERSSPRSHVRGNIYTSTDYPADRTIFLHNENSYQYKWPLKIFFFCVQPAQEGGETPIADVRKIFQRLRPEITDKFAEKKVMYVRNFGDGFGLDWQIVFQTSDRMKVEDYCRNNQIEFEWKSGNRLRTKQVRQAVIRHPKTGEFIWFNHAAFFHISTLEPNLRQSLLASFKVEDLPHNTYYGDGSPIEDFVIEEIRAAYQQETISFPWKLGDILMLDNMLIAHGRAPFVGLRKIVVGMSEPYSDSGN